MSRSRAAVVLLILTIVLAALAVGSVRLDSLTSDEPAYIGTGMIKVVHGRLDFFRDQPPLMNSISALPLVLAGYKMPSGWKVGGNHWEIGRAFLYAPGHDTARMLLMARLPTIALFFALCLAVYFFVVHATGNRMWGVAAFALTGFCPNLMAHGRLATVDLAVTLFSFAAAALLLRLLEQPSIGYAVAFGAAVAAAALSKTSGNILLPYAALVLLTTWITKRVSDPKRLLAMLGISVIAAVAVLEVVILAEASDSYLRENFAGLPRLAVPFAEYAANVRAISGWYARGSERPQFLLGQFSDGGWPHYYLVALLLKTPIPALVLSAIAAVVAIRRRWLPFPAAMSLLFVLLFLGVASASELALGVRYVLPIYPFLFAAVAIVLSAVKTKRAMALLGLLLAWHVAENVIAYPSYLSYFNQFIGNHRRADRYLIDSNLDWGQDLRRLDAWAQEEGVDAIAIHYFGGAIPPLDLKARVIGGYGPGRRLLPPGWFALSRHYYRLSFSPRVSVMTYDDYLAQSRARYVTTVGGSIDVYQVP